MESTTEIPNKQDLYKCARRFKVYYTKLETQTAFSFQENNVIVKKYIDAKVKGNYRSLLYQVNQPDSTLSKNIIVLMTIEKLLKKQFSLLTQDDIDDFQTKLNSDTFYTLPTFRKSKKISFRFKQDLVKTLKQFWKFYRLYARNELKTEVPDIVEYLRVKRPKENNQFMQFLTKEDVDAFASDTYSVEMKAFLTAYFETGGRVIEMLLLKKHNCIFDENKKTWIVRLPNEKGISTGKLAIELSFSNNDFNKWMNVKKFKSEEDYVFDYSYEYIKKFFSERGKKLLGRHVTPKQMRKGTTMFLVNANVNEQYIRAHMGWSPSSKAIANYINQMAIKRPDLLDKAIQSDFYTDVMKENESLKFKQKIQQDQIQNMLGEIRQMRTEQLKIFEKMTEIDVSASKNLLKTIFEEMKNGTLEKI